MTRPHSPPPARRAPPPPGRGRGVGGGGRSWGARPPRALQPAPSPVGFVAFGFSKRRQAPALPEWLARRQPERPGRARSPLTARPGERCRQPLTERQNGAKYETADKTYLGGRGSVLSLAPP